MKAGPRGGLLFLATLVVASLLAPYLAPFAADALDLANRRAAPSLVHWFGTDELGRDVLTRVLVGARVSLAIGVLSALMSAAIGVAVGAVAGYAGRWVDDVLMRAIRDAGVGPSPEDEPLARVQPARSVTVA